VLAQVDVAGDGGSPDVVPVLRVRSQLLRGGGLDRVNPGGDLELACEWSGRMSTLCVALL
jgi:hypothetical protein